MLSKKFKTHLHCLKRNGQTRATTRNGSSDVKGLTKQHTKPFTSGTQSSRILLIGSSILHGVGPIGNSSNCSIML